MWCLQECKTLHVRYVYTLFCKIIDLITCKAPKIMSATAREIEAQLLSHSVQITAHEFIFEYRADLTDNCTIMLSVQPTRAASHINIQLKSHPSLPSQRPGARKPQG